MSCVTMTIVLRTADWIRRNSPMQLAARDGIERTKGLVHQQNRWIGGERARDADALALAAQTGVPGAAPRIVGRQANQSEQLVNAAADPPLVPAEQPRHDRDVVAHGQVRKEADFLKDVPDVPAKIERVPVFHGSTADDDARPHPAGAID